MADSRVFFKLDVGYFRNPKIAPLLDECRDAVFVHQAAIAYSREHVTDGVVPVRRVMADVLVAPCGSLCGSQCTPICVVQVLVQAGLFERIDARTVRVHDYAEHNQTAADIERSRVAGQKGAESRWGKSRSANPTANRNADRIATANADRNGVRHANANAEERRGEPTRARTPARAREERFTDFWAAYPRKVAKAPAQKAWAKAVKDTDPDVIIEALTAQGPMLGAREAQYVPHAASWLNGRRWEDERPTIAAAAGDYDAYRDAPRPTKLTFHDDD